MLTENSSSRHSCTSLLPPRFTCSKITLRLSGDDRSAIFEQVQRGLSVSECVWNDDVHTVARASPISHSSCYLHRFDSTSQEQMQDGWCACQELDKEAPLQQYSMPQPSAAREGPTHTSIPMFCNAIFAHGSLRSLRLSIASSTLSTANTRSTWSKDFSGGQHDGHTSNPSTPHTVVEATRILYPSSINVRERCLGQ